MTGFADQVLLEEAQVTSEGAIERKRGVDPVYFGSTMVTVSLNTKTIGGLAKGATTEMLLAAAQKSISLHIRLMRLARREAEHRCAPLLPRGMLADLQFKIDGELLLVDINVECPLARTTETTDDAEVSM